MDETDEVSTDMQQYKILSQSKFDNTKENKSTYMLPYKILSECLELSTDIVHWKAGRIWLKILGEHYNFVENA